MNAITINPNILLNSKIKPLIGFMVDIKWNTKRGIVYLAKDRPKLRTISNTNRPTGGEIGNKGIRQLCETLRSSKNVKKMIIDICGSNELRILTKWLKTSRNLKALQIVVPWRTAENLRRDLLFLKYVKNLEDFTFEIWKNGHLFIFPKMKLYHLSSLKKLKVKSIMSREDNPRFVSSILNGFKGLDKLDELDLDLSFLSCLSDIEIQSSMNYLKEIKNLRCLRLDLNYCKQLSPLAIKELISYLSSLRKLESCYLRFSILPYLSFETIEKLIASVKNNSDLKNLVLATAETIEPQGEELQCLNLKTFNHLQSLKLTLSANSKPISNHLLQGIAETLERNPQLEVLDFWLRFKPSGLQGHKLFCGSLQNLKSLLTLRLSVTQASENSSDNEHMEALTESLKSLKKLENLNLDFHCCALSSKSIAQIAEGVDSLQYLKILHLDFSYPPTKLLNYVLFLRKSGLGSFGPVFGRHQSLSSITLLTAGLKPTDQEYEELGQGIGALKTLKSFEFSSNHLGPSLNHIYQSLAASPVLSCLSLRLTEMKHQDLENLFGNLQNVKNLKRLKFDFLIQSLSEKAVENLIHMIRSLTSLISMELSVDWSEKIDLNLILKFYNGTRYFDHYVDCDWKCWGRSLQEQEMCKNILNENSKYLEPIPFPVRYSCKQYL